MKYLFNFEDGTFWQADKYTEKDLESIDAGILSVMRFKDNKFQDLNAEGEWVDIDEK